MESSAWKKKSSEYIKNAKKCARCGSFYNLGCHHKTYDNLGKETYKDIIVLCWDCHQKYHKNLKGKRINIFKKFRKLNFGEYSDYITKRWKCPRYKNEKK